MTEAQNRPPVSEVVSSLKDTLGVRLTAVIAGVKTGRTVERWARGQQRPLRSREQNLRAALGVATLLQERESPETIRAWFTGMNPELNDVSPALTIGQNIERVDAAARTFLANG